MEELALKYNSRFVVTEFKTNIPEGVDRLARIKDMNTKFKSSLVVDDVWDKRKLYLMLMFIHRFETIKKHVIEYPKQDKRWEELINNHLPDLINKHLNFKLNAVELVVNVLNIFFII